MGMFSKRAILEKSVLGTKRERMGTGDTAARRLESVAGVMMDAMGISLP